MTGLLVAVTLFAHASVVAVLKFVFVKLDIKLARGPGYLFLREFNVVFDATGTDMIFFFVLCSFFYLVIAAAFNRLID